MVPFQPVALESAQFPAASRQPPVGRRPAAWPGATSEQDLSDACTEFGTINGGFAGRSYRYTYAATSEPGWFLFNGLVKHDTVTGREERYQFEPGVFCSEVASLRVRAVPEMTMRIS